MEGEQREAPTEEITKIISHRTWDIGAISTVRGGTQKEIWVDPKDRRVLYVRGDVETSILTALVLPRPYRVQRVKEAWPS